MLFGCTMCSASACGLSSCSWLNVASSSPTKPFVVGARIRPELCQPPAPPAAMARGQVAHGRGVHPDPGHTALSLARRGSVRRGTRHPGSGTPRCQSRQALLQVPAEGCGHAPRVIVTDKLRSYGVAKRHLLPDVEHRQSRYLNNRAENSHRPTGRRERQMQRFKSPEQGQHFLAAHAFIHGHFHPRRHLLSADAYRAIRSDAFDVWQQETWVQHATWCARERG
jgi:putative transposase